MADPEFLKFKIEDIGQGTLRGPFHGFSKFSNYRDKPVLDPVEKSDINVSKGCPKQNLPTFTTLKKVENVMEIKNPFYVS